MNHDTENKIYCSNCTHINIKLDLCGVGHCMRVHVCKIKKESYIDTYYKRCVSQDEELCKNKNAFNDCEDFVEKKSYFQQVLKHILRRLKKDGI
jgi:hypothetical protein